jgi:hypothetical protein
MGRKSSHQGSFDFDSDSSGSAVKNRSAQVVDLHEIRNRLHASRVLESLKESGLVKVADEDKGKVED